MDRAVVKETSSDRLSFLEGMRGFAALVVVVGHIFSLGDPTVIMGHASHAPEWIHRLALGAAASLHLAVAAFIVLSGFCLQLAQFNRGEGQVRSAGRFFARRARRILPAYYASLILSCAVAYWVTPHLPDVPFSLYRPLNQETITTHLLLIQNWSPAWMYKINGVLWSIAIEAQLYFLFPALTAGMMRRSRGVVLVITVLITMGVLQFAPNGLKLYPWYLPLFALGIAAAQWVFRPDLEHGHQPEFVRKTFWFAAFGLVAAFALNLPVPVADGFLGLGVASICYLGSMRARHEAIRFFSTRGLVALGSFSYSLYLIHHPILQILSLWAPVDPTARLIYLFGAGVPVALLSAYVFSWCFERPFLNAQRAEEPVFSPLSLPLKVASRASENSAYGC